MPIATMHRINDWFKQAFRGLAVDVPTAEIQHLAMLVHQCMEVKTRTYHTAFHVLSLCEGMQPIQILAALFHDVVFYQVDGGVPACMSALLQDVTHPEPGFLRLTETLPEDRTFALCVDIFGFHPGQRLSPRDGMNEFLSAVVAARLLRAHLNSLQLMAVVACIELTVPFRAPDEKGQTAAQRLARRVQACCIKLAPALSDKDRPGAAFIKTTVTDAVDLANRDVTGFVEADPECCLINTMLLIEESMMPRAVSGDGSQQAYRDALLGMDTFLSQLNPAWVGQSFDGHPTAHRMTLMQTTARKNIIFVRDYLAAVLNALAILEALKKCASGKSSLALSLMSMPCAQADRLSTPAAGTMVHAGLHQLLKNGLAAQENPALVALPLAACVYGFLGHDATQETLTQAKQMFGGTLPPRTFLQNLDRDLVGAIIRSEAEINQSHKEAFLALGQSLYSNSAVN